MRFLILAFLSFNVLHSGEIFLNYNGTFLPVTLKYGITTVQDVMNIASARSKIPVEQIVLIKNNNSDEISNQPTVKISSLVQTGASICVRRQRPGQKKTEAVKLDSAR